LALSSAASAAATGRPGGGAMGPIITFSGFATPNGMILPTTQLPTGSGFVLVVEGRPGPLNRPVGTSTFDPGMLPDIQFQVTQQLGNGSIAVCDMDGGVPATSPPDLSFSNTDAVNDLACRFTSEGCLVNQLGEPVFANPSSTVQFCAVIGPPLAFQNGETVVTVRLRDIDGVVGPVQQLTVRVGAVQPTPTHTTGVTAPASATATRTAPPTASASATRTAAVPATATAPMPTPTVSAGPSSTPASTTPTAMATASPTAGTLIDLDSLLRALFSPTPPVAADVNGDQRVTAADVTEHRLRSLPSGAARL
jgi:hypothetical protein